VSKPSQGGCNFCIRKLNWNQENVSLAIHLKSIHNNFQKKIEIEDDLKKVESASVATAFAKYDFPVPGGPYRRKARHGLRFPVFTDGKKTYCYRTHPYNETLQVCHRAMNSITNPQQTSVIVE